MSPAAVITGITGFLTGILNFDFFKKRLQFSLIWHHIAMFKSWFLKLLISLICILIENHVITSVQVKVKSFQPILQAFFSCLQFPCRHVLPVHTAQLVGSSQPSCGEGQPASDAVWLSVWLWVSRDNKSWLWTWGIVCLPLSLFRDVFSLAIQMASAMPRWNQSFSLHLTVTASEAKLWLWGTPVLMFFGSCTQWILCLSDVGCLAVCTADMVHKARLFTFLDFVLWSYQAGPNGAVWSYMGSYTCLIK